MSLNYSIYVRDSYAGQTIEEFFDSIFEFEDIDFIRVEREVLSLLRL